MTKLLRYKVILWDFDGVIMDSMPVRDLGFELVLKGYPEDQVAKLMKYHRQNGGLSRYHKFRYFFEGIREQPVTELQVRQMAEKFSIVMLQHLLDPKLLISDSLNFITENHNKYRMHVVSGSDQNELRCICETLGLSRFFISIHGSPTPKKELVRELLAYNNYDPSSCCLIGDSLNDLEAAEANGVNFFGYNNIHLASHKSCYIDRFGV